MDLTPVIDMSFLLIVFFLCLPFKALDHKLAAYLPTNRGSIPVPFQPPEEVVIRVQIRENPADPLHARFLCSGRVTSDPEEVFRCIREGMALLQSEGLQTVGEIVATPKVPLKFVVAVLNKFTEAGIGSVRFSGLPVPRR